MSESKFRPLPQAALLALIALPAPPYAAQHSRIERVSVTPNGDGGNGYCYQPSLSWDGRVIAYASNANNLVPGDSNGQMDIFGRDRNTDTTFIASVTSAGLQSNAGSAFPCVSGDGRFISFRSAATNLDPRDPDPGCDIYLHDGLKQTTVLVSERTVPGSTPEGAWNSSLSSDGRFVAFDGVDDNFAPGDNNHRPDVFVRDIQAGTVEIVSLGNGGEQGDGPSSEPSISSDGRFVAFTSWSSNWFPGNPKGVYNVYLRDRLEAKTLLISHTPAGGYGVWGGGGMPSISTDGGVIAYMYKGLEPMPWLGNLRQRHEQAYAYSVASSTPAYVSEGYSGGIANHINYFPKISGNGRYVAWESYASNLVPHPGDGDQDIFLRDTLTDVTIQVSRGMSGEAPNAYSVDPAINFDGTVVAFASKASNLVPGDVGGMVDIFVYECRQASPTVYCEGMVGSSGCGPKISFDGDPSAAAGSGFTVCGEDLLANQPALLMYSARGGLAHRYLGGLLCIEPPCQRTPPQLLAGTPGSCEGLYAFDMNAWIAGGQDPRLVAGEVVYAQLWSRDPADPHGAVLSDAVAFLIGP